MGPYGSTRTNFLDCVYIYFIAGLLAFLLGFGSFIAFVSRKLSGRITQRTFSWIERLFIAGILLGAAGMFQPWVLVAYRFGFLVILVSTLGYIVWSHVQP